MRRIKRNTLAALAAAAGLVALAAGPASAATAPAPGSQPGALVAGTQSTCFWYYGAVGDGTNSNNIAYPDAGAYYWGAYYRRPAGSTLKLRGTFPYARYTSLISYDVQGQVVDGIADYQYDPDAGSVNPFRAGEDRSAANRAYTVNVLSQKNLTNQALPPGPTNPPLHALRPKNSEPATNDLYATPNTPGLTETVNGTTYTTQLLLLRTYVPDNGRDFNGDVPLPEPELKLSDGTTLTGQALCDTTDSQSQDRLNNGLSFRLPEPTSLLINTTAYQALRHPETLAAACNVFAAVGCPTSWVSAPPALVQIPRSTYYPAAGILGSTAPPATNPAIDPSTFPALPTANWRSQYDRRYLLQLYTGDNAPGANLAPVRAGGGGFFPNNHNNYTRDALSRKFGKVVVLRGKLPTSPVTRSGGGTWQNSHDFQVRYTSFCMNESVRSTKVMDCVYDEEIPTDSQGRYTIVISRTDDKPANSDQGCGRSWIQWKASGDGETPPLTDEDFGWLQIRNMLPDPTFAEAIQNTNSPGDEQAVMGDYLPSVTYMSQADVESSGCGYSGLQQPINQDGSSIFKLGQTIPVKFHLSGASGEPVDDSVAKLEIAPVSGAVEGTYMESASTSAADSGNVFRSLGNGDYIYNLSTDSLDVGTWSLRVTFKDGTVYREHISLR